MAGSDASWPRGWAWDCTRSFFEPWCRTGVERVTRKMAKAGSLDSDGVVLIVDGSDAFDVSRFDVERFEQGSKWLAFARRSSNLRLAAKRLVQEDAPWAPQVLGRVAAFPFWVAQKIFEKAYQKSLMAKVRAHCVKLDRSAYGIHLVCDFLPSKDTLRYLDKNNRGWGAIVYDLIPMTHPQFCPDEAWRGKAESWLRRCSKESALNLCISKFTQSEFSKLLPKGESRVFRLGFDFSAGSVAKTSDGGDYGINGDFVLVVGSIEPRKNIDRLVRGYESYLAQSKTNDSLSLVIAGKKSWGGDLTIQRIKASPLYGKKVFYFEEPSDAVLGGLYVKSKALFYPSEVEGFGLPLVEALSVGKPVWCSDISVFEEIANGHPRVRYFSPRDADSISNAFEECANCDISKLASQEFVWPSWDGSYQEAKQRVREVSILLAGRSIDGTGKPLSQPSMALLDFTHTYFNPWIATGIQRVARRLAAGIPEHIDARPSVRVMGRAFASEDLVGQSGIVFEKMLPIFNRLAALRERVSSKRRKANLGMKIFLKMQSSSLFILQSALQKTIQFTLGVSAIAKGELMDSSASFACLTLDLQDADEMAAFRRGHGNMKWIATVFDTIPKSHPRLCASDAFVSLVDKWHKEIASNACGSISISQFTQDEFTRLYQPKGHALHAHLGSDFSSNASLVPRAPRGSNALPEVFYLCVGTIEPRKNVSHLLDAFDRIEDESIGLVLVGKPGWKSDDVLRRIESHSSAGKRLIHYPWADDSELMWLYEKSKALVFPSMIEGFGLPAVEALAKSKQVLASDIPAFREACLGDPRARFFDLNSVDALADLMVRTAVAEPVASLGGAVGLLTWSSSSKLWGEKVLELSRLEAKKQ